jgi:hypothetical protein
MRDLGSFQNGFLETSLGSFSDDAALSLANRIEGLLAEAVHASWSESGLREELTMAIDPLDRRRPLREPQRA